jgi:prepilin-type N-terminal cleavage/methylation domain-containing protein
MKRGVTLLELVVAMGLFAIIATLAIGGYVTVSRMRSLTTSMRESQQKMRMAMEYITRSAKQADKIIVSSDGQQLTLYFDSQSATISAARFTIKAATGRLDYDEDCKVINPTTGCTDWTDASGNPDDVNLLSDRILLVNVVTDSWFKKNAVNGNPELEIKLKGKYGIVGNNSEYYKDDFTLATAVILENIK